MDPNKTLANIRAIIAEMNRGCTESQYNSLADELSWMIRDLDNWMSRGGFLPTDWNTSRPQLCTVTTQPKIQ